MSVGTDYACTEYQWDQTRSDRSIRYNYSASGMNRPLIATWRSKIQINETEEERYRMMTFHVLLDLTNCLAYHYSRSSFNEASRSRLTLWVGDYQLGPSSSNRTRMTVYKEIIHTNTLQVWSPQRKLNTCKSILFSGMRKSQAFTLSLISLTP